MKKLSSVELLEEIQAWLSFNTSPSKEDLLNLREDIRKHIKENYKCKCKVCSSEDGDCLRAKECAEDFEYIPIIT